MSCVIFQGPLRALALSGEPARRRWVLSLFYLLTFGGFVAPGINLPTLLKEVFRLTSEDVGACPGGRQGGRDARAPSLRRRRARGGLGGFFPRLVLGLVREPMVVRKTHRICDGAFLEKRL